jgi:three-Cys-motif partner protein
MNFDVRPVQTKVKHAILGQYAGAWAGIIKNGVRGIHRARRAEGKPFTLDLIYVDGFGGEGRYTADFDGSPGPIWGSPIVAMKALIAQARMNSGVPVRVSGVVTEEDASRHRTLLRSIRDANLGISIAEQGALTPDSFGKLTVLRGDFRDHLDSILHWMGPYAFALAFVDPDGPSMPMDDIQKILRREHTDAIVLFPFLDLQVRSGSAAKAESEWTKMDQQNVAVRSRHFGTKAWIDIARAELSSTEREAKLAALYMSQLAAADSKLVVKNIPLQLGEIGRTAYHLCLTTRDADGAMRMNDVLRGAEIAEELIRWRGREAREEAAAAADAQCSLALETPFVEPPKITPKHFTPEEVAGAIGRLRAGRWKLKEIYGALANDLYTDAEIKRALKYLRDKGEASYTSLESARSEIHLGRLAASPLRDTRERSNPHHA